MDWKILSALIMAVSFDAAAKPASHYDETVFLQEQALSFQEFLEECQIRFPHRRDKDVCYFTEMGVCLPLPESRI
jgi:hypothetical protein